MVFGGGDLWVVGEFTTVNGVPQQGITRFADEPDTGYVDAPVLTAASNSTGKITVSWTAGYDLDDDKVTYELFREGTAAPISVQTVRSREWSRPRMSYTDTVGGGVTASYRIRTSDGDNISPKGAAVTATAATTDLPYAGAVSEDAPHTHWRLDETAGTTAVDSSGGGHLGSYANVTLRGASALADGDGLSATFNGTNSRVNTVDPDRVAAVSDYSLELWFRTTSNRGGKLIGYGNSRTGNSSKYDRHLYLTNAGNVVYGNYPGSAQTVISPSGYRDGQWHHVVGTTGPQGMRLYVDGRQVGANTVTSGQSYFGWWRVGGDTIGSGWPSRPRSNYFSAGIDEVGIYDKQLTSARIFEHFRQGRPSGWTDTADPSRPGVPAATTRSSRVSLTWTASTDDMLVAGYRVHRSQTSGFTPDDSTLVGNTDWASFDETGVPPGTWYYRVVAVDGVGRTSAASAEREVSVADTEAPSAPRRVTAEVFDDEVDLSWQPSTDDTAVTGYDVHRLPSASATPSPETLVGTTLGTRYTETAVPDGTWYYRVLARDAAGNVGTPSAAVEANTRRVGSDLDLTGPDTPMDGAIFTSTHPASGVDTTIDGATLVRPNDARFRFTGATGFSFGTTYPDTLFLQPSSRYPSARGSQPVYSVEFTTNAPVFEVFTKYLKHVADDPGEGGRPADHGDPASGRRHQAGQPAAVQG